MFFGLFEQYLAFSCSLLYRVDFMNGCSSPSFVAMKSSMAVEAAGMLARNIGCAKAFSDCIVNFQKKKRMGGQKEKVLCSILMRLNVCRQ